ncbi:MAG: CotH kinase family protein [Phaeodactylibacter sp.]|nr:CotH kinase family protein [Phaeodactylibacter sp.]
MSYKPIHFFLILLFPVTALAQVVDHWEAAVLAEQDWRYRLGDAEPPITWNQPGFDASSWAQGAGGFGYEDGDDNTVIPATVSVYLRKDFTITDTDLLAAVSLYADYDDAFVAYLNGVEIARANIGTVGQAPAHNATAITYREAQLYQGGLPESFPVNLQQLDGLLVNGTNTLAVQVHNVGLTSSDLSSLFYLLFGISDASNDYYPVPDWFPESFTSSNLPLLLINTSGVPIPDEPKIDAHLGIIDNGPGNLNFLSDPLNGYDGLIGIELRGSSSLTFPKKNYSLETRLENGENNNVPLLGMPEENDWVLHGPYSDKSLMRNVLSFHIGNRMGGYAPRTRWCEVFINGEYMGIYVLMEKIKRDDNRVDIANLKPEDIAGDELTGGYIFSVDRDDQGPESGWHSPYTDLVFYRYQDPGFDELQPEQKNYLRDYVMAFEAAMNTSPTEDTYAQYIDVPSWIDYWIATEIFKHIDNFKLSFYMYKRKESNGGKIHFGPLWDLNLGYGNFDFVQDPGPQGWSYEWVNTGILRPFWVLDLSEDAQLQHKIQCRWQELRQGSLQTDSLLAFVDNTAALIEEARIRNFDRWPILGTYVWPNSFVGQTYDQDFNFFRNWLIERLEWMDEHLPGDCSLADLGKVPERAAKLEVFPNPFLDQVTFAPKGAYPEAGKLILLDALGRTMAERAWDTGGAPQLFSFPALAPGLYFYQLKAAGLVVASGKLVKE